MSENLRMKAARALKALTQRKLAALVGTREIEISRIETGRVSPEAWLRESIAWELGIQTWEVGA
jgi:DNA-binding XRE family transcriptional regulator